MYELRGSHMLQEVILSECSNCFKINEYNKLEEFYKRTRSNFAQRLLDEDQEVVLSLSLKAETLVTHFSIYCSTYPFGELLQFLFSYSSSLSDNQQFKKMVNTNLVPGQDGYHLIESIGFSRNFRLTFLFRQQYLSEYMKRFNLKIYRSKTSFYNGINNLLKVLLKRIKIWGYLPNTNPPASHVAPLMNISYLLRKACRNDYAVETDILLGLCLINGRRFSQAVELLRKVSDGFVNRCQSDKDYNSKTFFYQEKSKVLSNDFMHFSWNCSAGILNNQKRNLLRAAKIELLIAYATSHPSMNFDRVQAYLRAASYFSNYPLQDRKNTDIYTVLLNICPYLMNLLNRCLYDTFYPFKLAAIKTLYFVLYSIGCSAGNYLPQIIKSIVVSYPIQQNSIGYSPRNDLEDTKKRIDHNTKLIMDHYHHLLYSIQNLIPQLARNINRLIFQDIVMQHAFAVETSSEIRSYVLRIADKILSICQADIDLQITFITNILSCCIGKGSFMTRYKVHSSLIYQCQKVWETLKIKYLQNLKGTRLLKIAYWATNNISFLCDHDFDTRNQGTVEQSLYIVSTVYRNKNISEGMSHPIQPLLYMLNISINNSAVPFDKVLTCLSQVLHSYTQSHKTTEVVEHIIAKIIHKTTIDTLKLRYLQILVYLLKLCPKAYCLWLYEYLENVPHSTFDYTFIVLDELLKKCFDNLTQSLLHKVITTLIHQYTVKGKAHKKTKYLLISLVIDSELLYDFLGICLTDNREPLTHYSKRKKQHDSKEFAQQYEIFLYKLAIGSYVMLLLKKPRIIKMIECDFLKKLADSLVKLALSQNSKCRSKSSSILKSIVDVYAEEPVVLSHIYVILCRCLLTPIKAHLTQHREAKLQFTNILTLTKMFKSILHADKSFLKSYRNISISSFLSENDLYNIDTSKEFRFYNNEAAYLNIRIRYIIRLWTQIVSYLSSPWGFVKEASCQLLIELLSVDISRYKICYQQKIIELLLPILQNLLESPYFSDRVYGLRIYASAIGMAAQYSDKSCINLVRSKSLVFKDCFKRIYMLTYDWNEYVNKLATIIVQLGINKETRLAVRRMNNSGRKSISHIISNSFFGSIHPYYSHFLSPYEDDIHNLEANIDNFLRESVGIAYCSYICSYRSNEYALQRDYSFTNNPDDILEYWLEKYPSERIFYELSIFRSYVSLYNNWLHDDNPPENFYNHEEQHVNYDSVPNVLTKEEPKDEYLDFEDLGIIEVDDEYWSDYEHEMRFMQKLPVKRKYKLSPHIASPVGQNLSKIDPLPPIESEIKYSYRNQQGKEEDIIVDDYSSEGSIEPKREMKREIKESTPRYHNKYHRYNAQKEHQKYSREQFRYHMLTRDGMRYANKQHIPEQDAPTPKKTRNGATRKKPASANIKRKKLGNLYPK